jgi:hypothetical protein
MKWLDFFYWNMESVLSLFFPSSFKPNLNILYIVNWSRKGTNATELGWSGLELGSEDERITFLISSQSRLDKQTSGVFSFQNILVLGTVVFFVLFDNYCSIMD